MAITNGRITHDEPQELSKSSTPAEFRDPAEAGGIFLREKQGGGYPFFGDWISDPINLKPLEVTSLGKLNFKNGHFSMDGNTLDLIVAPFYVSGTLRNFAPSGADVAISGNYSLFSNPQRMYMNGSVIQFGNNTNYTLDLPLKIEVGYIGNFTKDLQPYGQNPHLFDAFEVGNYSASGGGIKLQAKISGVDSNNGVPPHRFYFQHVLLTATMRLTNGTDLEATLQSPISTHATYAAVWDGEKLSVAVSASGETYTASSSAASSPPLSSSQAMTLKSYPDYFGPGNYWRSDHQITGVKISRDSNLSSITPVLLVSNPQYNKTVALTRTAASSGNFKNDWKGASGDGSYLISDMSNLSFLPDVGFQSLTLGAGGTPISGGDYNAIGSAFDGTNATWWGSSQVGGGVMDNAWIGYDFGEGKEQAVSAIILDQSAGSSNGVTRVRIDRGSATTWSPVLEVDVPYGISRLILPPGPPARRWRVVAKSGTSAGNGVWAVNELSFLANAPASGSTVVNGITFTVDNSQETPFTRVSAPPDSNGKAIPIKLFLSVAIPPQNFVKLSLGCDNPEALFKLNFHSTASSTAPGASAPAFWSYVFRVDSAEWKDFFFPDFSRASMPSPGANYYWFTLEILDAAGGFNLDMRDMQFGKGLQSGEVIQSPLNYFLQYRLIFLTNF